jgi:hypothetical protein
MNNREKKNPSTRTPERPITKEPEKALKPEYSLSFNEANPSRNSPNPDFFENQTPRPTKIDPHTAQTEIPNLLCKNVI